MTNKKAMKEIARLRDCYYDLSEQILDNCGRGERKEAIETTNNIQETIYALDTALTAMQHVETVAKGESHE